MGPRAPTGVLPEVGKIHAETPQGCAGRKGPDDQVLVNETVTYVSTEIYCCLID